MEVSSSPSVREAFQILTRLSVARCRASGNTCSVSVCFRLTYGADSVHSVRVSVSDTGVGCSQKELQDVGDCINCSLVAVNDWDGELHVTTTCIGDKDIHNYQLCVKETTMSRRIVKLSSTPKNGMKFSGSEMSFNFEMNEKSINDLIAWAANFVGKILILKVPMIAFELLIEHVKCTGSRHEYLLRAVDGLLLPHSMSAVERLASGLQDYVLKHGNTVDRECISCFENREHLKLGNGVARNAAGQTVEVAIAMVGMALASCKSCSQGCCLKSEVLYFQEFSPRTISQSTFNALKSVNWQSYGLKLKTEFTDECSFHVLEWENLSSFSHIVIALHSYGRQYPKLQAQQRSPTEKSIIKRAVQFALDDLKSKYEGILLSRQSSKVLSYAPELSRTLAGLILSSNDSSFQAECVSLLGLQPVDVQVDGRVESCIREKIINAIVMNDRNKKRGRQESSSLFECEGTQGDEDGSYQQNSEEGEEDYAWAHEGLF